MSAQGLSPSRILAVTSSRIGGSTVLSAATSRQIARARAWHRLRTGPHGARRCEDDRACLEQGEIAFLIGRNQTERMKAQMRAFRLRLERDKAHLVVLAHLFKRPANARIARQARPPSGDRSNAVMTMVIGLVSFLRLKS